MSRKVQCKVLRGSPDGKIVADEIERELAPREVVVEITHSAICGTDHLYQRAPQVLGHEGVGIVKETGADVESVKIGDRVGLHYRQEICGKCPDCLAGWDQFCYHKKDFGKNDLNQGTCATTMTWHESTLIKIPDGCESINAATLMCSGATAWTALACQGLKADSTVGVMGIGGLGHLAIKLAVAMGFKVVALSSSEKKRTDCERWGAHEYIVYEPGRPTSMDGKLDALLLCGNSAPDFGKLMPLMANQGTIYMLTVAFEPSAVPSLALVDRGLAIKGSHVASILAMQDMLQYCVNKGISGDVERFPFTADGLDDAFKSIDAGSIRYKAVLCRD